MVNNPLENLKSRYEDLSNNPQIYTPSDTLPITAGDTTTIPKSNESFWRKSTNFLFSEAKGLGEDIAEYTSPDVKRFRQSNDELRAKGGEYAKIADEMEAMYGKRPDNLFAKTLADFTQTAMWIAPVPGFKFLKGLPVLKKALSLGSFGGVYAGMEGVGEGEQIDKILKDTMIGFGAGATLGFAGHYFLKYGTKIPEAVSAVYKKVVPQEFRTALGNLFLPVGGRLSLLGKEAGQYGKKIMDGIKTIRSKEMEWLGASLSRMAQIGMLDMKGLIKSQTMIAKPLAERIDVTRRLMGMKPKIVSEELDNAAQVIRAEYMQTYHKFAEVGTPVGYRENYFNHVILNPEKQLSSLDEQAFKFAKTQEEKFAILNKDETIGNVFKWAVEDLKAFDDYDDAYNVFSDWAKWVNGGGHKLTSKRGQALVKWMIKTGQATSLDDANRKLLRSYQDYINPLFNKSKFLENRREIDLPFYDPDPQKYVPLYLVDAIKRTAELSTFGPKGIDKLLDKLQKATDIKTAQVAREYVERILGTVKKSPLNDADALSWLRSLNASKLNFTQVMNLGQNLSTLMLSDLRGLGHGLKAAFSKEGVMESLKSGVGVQEILRTNLATYRDTTWAGKWGDWNLKWSGFSWSERFNRVVAAHSFMDYTKRELANLLKNPTDKITRFRLQELNIDPDNALAIMRKTGGVVPKVEVKPLAQEAPDLLKMAQEYKAQGKIVPISKEKFIGSKNLIAENTPEQVEGGIIAEARFTSAKEVAKGKWVSTPMTEQYYRQIPFAGVPEDILTKIKQGGGATLSADELKRLFKALDENDYATNAGMIVKGYVGNDIILGTTKINGAMEYIVAGIGKDGKFENIRLHGTYIGNKDIIGRTTQINVKQLTGETFKEAEPVVGKIIPKEIPNELETMIRQAGFTGANKTQFINLSETLPYWFTSPTGKMFTQFKSYSYNQVRLVMERLSGRVKTGDYKGLVRDVSILGLLFPMYGEVAEDFRALVSGKKRPMVWYTRYLDNLTSAGAFGLGWDLFNTLENKRLLNWMAGPTVGTVSAAIENSYEDIMKGEISDKTYRLLFSQLGFPRVLNYRLFPPRKYDKPVGDPLQFWEKIMK